MLDYGLVVAEAIGRNRTKLAVKSISFTVGHTLRWAADAVKHLLSIAQRLLRSGQHSGQFMSKGTLIS